MVVYTIYIYRTHESTYYAYVAEITIFKGSIKYKSTVCLWWMEEIIHISVQYFRDKANKHDIVDLIMLIISTKKKKTWSCFFLVACQHPGGDILYPSTAIGISGPQHCCIILVSIQFTYRYGTEKKHNSCSVHSRLSRSLYGWQNKYSFIQSIGLIPNSSINAWYIFGCPWKWKLRVIENTLWYTWYIFECLKKMRGMLRTCIVYFWVSLIKRNTCYNGRINSWYIFLSFSEKKKDMR